MNKHPDTLTEARKSRFLEVVEKTGNLAWAAKSASPHLADSESAVPGLSTFKKWMQQDSKFAAAVELAREQFRGELFETIRRRGMEGVQRPVYQGGKRVYDEDPETGEKIPATVTEYDSGLLKMLAKGVMPDVFGDRKQINIQHDVKVAGVVGYTITHADVAKLSREQAAQLAAILRTMRSARGGELTPEQVEQEQAELIELKEQEDGTYE